MAATSAEALERVTDGVFALDLQWNYVYINGAGARLVGSTVENLIGRNIWHVFPEAVDSVFDQNYRRAIDHQEIIEFENYFSSLDRWYSIHVYPSPDGLTIYFQDTTQRHLAEEAGQRALAEAHDALEGTIRALSRVTEARDPYTAGHQAAVSKLAAAIASAMNLGQAAIENIRLGAQIHDIGKSSIPAEILTRPGRLSDLEFEMIKEHTLVGWEILSKSNLPAQIAVIARDHHERLDGTGYPHGLVGNQIDVPTRIVAVADVVEAMMHHRPYRSALGVDVAIAEIVAGAGVKYDPDVVAHCQLVLDSGFSF